MTTIVEAEAAWLSGDSDVTAALGTVLAYRSRETVDSTRATLTRRRMIAERIGDNLSQRTHTFDLTVEWPDSSSAFTLADAQHDLDVAVDALTARLLADITHGGLFQYAALGDNGLGSGLGVDVEITPVEATTDGLLATLTYSALEQHRQP